MADKPSTAAGYRSEFVHLVRSICLYIATKLGDLEDDLVVVGGLDDAIRASRSPPDGGFFSARNRNRITIDGEPFDIYV